MGQKPVQTGHPDVVETYHLVPEDLGGQRSLLRDGNVGGAAGCHQDRSGPVRFRNRTDDPDPRFRPVIQFKLRPDGFRGLRGEPGDQNRLLSVPLHGVRDSQNLGGRFPGPVYDFRRALADLPVEVDFRVPQIHERRFFQSQDRVLDAHFPGLHGLQNVSDFRFQPLTSRSSSTAEYQGFSSARIRSRFRITRSICPGGT